VPVHHANYSAIRLHLHAVNNAHSHHSFYFKTLEKSFFIPVQGFFIHLTAREQPGTLVMPLVAIHHRMLIPEPIDVLLPRRLKITNKNLLPLPEKSETIGDRCCQMKIAPIYFLLFSIFFFYL
jgi:hypothetical protein